MKSLLPIGSVVLLNGGEKCLMNLQPNIFRTTRMLSLSTFSSLEQTLSRVILIPKLRTSALQTLLNKIHKNLVRIGGHWLSRWLPIFTF